MKHQTKNWVLTAPQMHQLFQLALKKKFAIPAVNVTSSDTINAALAAAKQVKSPIIIQLSNSGAAFYAGKTLTNDHYQASVSGAVAAAKQIHALAEAYQVFVIIHTDHAAKKMLPWIDGMLAIDKEYFTNHKRPLFSSHMLDLSQESLVENINISKKYLKQMATINMFLEIELGVTGGEEDGIQGALNNKLYTTPEDVAYAYKELKTISDNFTIAASFGNVHGVYRPGKVKLKPTILRDSQNYISAKFSTVKKPVRFVFHGGSGSRPAKIREAVKYGVVKFNIDTDAQWAFWQGVKEYEEERHAYLQQQIGNPHGKNKANKKFYDPRKWLFKAEESMERRILKTYKRLNGLNINKYLDF